MVLPRSHARCAGREEQQRRRQKLSERQGHRRRTWVLAHFQSRSAEYVLFVCVKRLCLRPAGWLIDIASLSLCLIVRGGGLRAADWPAVPTRRGWGDLPLPPGGGDFSWGRGRVPAGRRRPARSFALASALSALREPLPPTFPAWRPRETHRGRVLLLACLPCGARCLPSLVLGASTFSRPRFGRLAVAIFGHTRTRPSQYINVYLLAHPRLEAGVTKRSTLARIGASRPSASSMAGSCRHGMAARPSRHSRRSRT